MPKVVKPLDIHNLLPQTNCKLCGESSCIAFATKLANRQTSIEKCPHLFKPDFSDKLQKLMELLAPPVKEVIIGVGDRAVKIGGKEVVYRHELTWRNPTAIFIDVHDEMSDQDISARFNFVKNFKFIRMGVELSIDGLAIRCVSGNPERYAKLVSKAVEEVGKPIALCCLEKEPLEEALIIAGNVKPLIYAATKDNWRDLAELASKHKCPLAILSNGDMALLKSLVKSVTEYYKVSELVLDPGTFAEEDVNVTLNNFVATRLLAIDGGDKELGYPLLGVPAALWTLSSKDRDNIEFEESVLASLLMSRFADMLIMHTISPWAIIPVLTWRDCVYTDPRVPSSVKPGLYKVGSPNESSPLMVTANFTLTYYIVKDDIEKGGVDAWLLVIDTEGTSVQSAVAGGRFTADKVFESMKAEDAFSKVSHKSIILPGYAAKISGELESLLGDWKVYVGPRDSADIL
ncbi:MAG: acetyl-CoA decarbonylase/synthase complex subunit gamma [Candidatus Methanomethylicota archaeon]|uniref:Acetyl-CoA decarbonylase/synthase complex subunit gamma n=1 Tax=Thermoproteota archaeon TaxID=2056631 RepID=A0A497EME0_9CREN|nr:MAG: acetyl-CoA decarbonylase/synthase complex subunit gamma [Candidatus Verstraetearchaeota archaeon]